MEYLNNFWTWLKSSPIWSRVAFPLLAAAACICYLLCSCGVTRARISTSADNTQSSITITTNNPTSVTLSNSVDSTKVNFSPKK